MNPAPASSQNLLSRLRAEARECLKQNDYQQAIEILQRAHRLDPANDRILLELGQANVMSYDFSAARKNFDQALRVSTSKPDALVAIGHHWMDIRCFATAAECFEKVLQESRIPVVTFIRLGEMFIRLRRLDDAAAIAERAMETHPDHEGVWLTRAKVHRHMKQWEPAEKLLRAVVSKSDGATEARSAAGYELGMVLDQEKRYDEAMAAWVEAKMRLRPGAAPVMATLRAKLTQMKIIGETISPTLVQRWRKAGVAELQPARRIALLCGYARSGTTLLEYVLDAHPQIVSADETSVFQNRAYSLLTRSQSAKTSFLSALDWMSPRTLRQIRQDYVRGIESFLDQPVGDRLLLDKNPALTFDIPALSRFFPEIKFLVALRDPRDVCLSCFMQATPVVADSVPWLSLEGTINHYADMMNYWLALKPSIGDAAIEVRYEDMVENLEANARRTLGFLGCEWDERVLRFDEHARSKVVCSPTFVEVAKPVYKTSLGRWRNYQKYFEPYLEKLAPLLKAFGYD